MPEKCEQNQLEKAIQLAATAHAGQRDKAGVPYILHPLRIMSHCKTQTQKIAAILHDTVEDTEVTLQSLRDDGFSEEIIAIVDRLTRRDDETYMQFIDRLSDNPDAVVVKMMDILDNMDLSRLSTITETDKSRLKRYQKAFIKLQTIYNSQNPAPNTHEIEINGCVSVPENLSVDAFTDQFLHFIDVNFWSFGGGVKEYVEWL